MCFPLFPVLFHANIFPQDPSIYPSLSPFTPYSSHPSIHPFSRLINLFPLCTYSQFCQSFNLHSFSLRFFNDPQRKRPPPNISRRFVLLAVNTLHINCKVTHFFDLLDLILQIKTHTYHLDRVGFDSPELSDSQVCIYGHKGGSVNFCVGIEDSYKKPSSFSTLNSMFPPTWMYGAR